MEKMIRLDKFLADMGKGSRSQIREAARKGRILVNGEPEKKTERKIAPGMDQVFLDGIPVWYKKYEYYMLNKPQGVVSATEDNLHRTVVDLLGEGPDGDLRRDLFPVGRLDRDTEGLLILTNDGELAHKLLSPKNHVDKVYYAQVKGRLPADAAAVMAEGMTLKDGTRVMPARLEKTALQNPGECQEIRLTIHEGKFHQVKRMFEALGCRVVYLKRISMGPLALDEGLAPGQYRPLTPAEIGMLKAAGTAKGPSGAVFAGKEERTEEGAKRPDLRRERG